MSVNKGIKVDSRQSCYFIVVALQNSFLIIFCKGVRNMIEKQKKYVNNENYIKIKGFMVNEMGLKGTSLFIYAIIYGMLQNNLKCTASIRYFEEWTNCSRSCVISAINKLVSEGLIQKEAYEDEFGQIRTSYLIEEINEFTCKSHYIKISIHAPW